MTSQPDTLETLPPLPAGLPEWAHNLHSKTQQQALLLNDQVRVTNELQQTIRRLEQQVLDQARRLEYETACRPLRAANGRAVDGPQPLQGIPTLMGLRPECASEADDVPSPLGPVPDGFPRTFSELFHINSQDCTRLLTAYGLTPSDDEDDNRSALADFIGAVSI